jgi:hypothetical protein
MKHQYRVLRPPLVESYELPTREELLSLKTGDLAKVTFRVGNDKAERMWVVLTDCTNPEEWHGTLDNDAIQESAAKILPAGADVAFHPLDIIAIE